MPLMQRALCLLRSFGDPFFDPLMVINLILTERSTLSPPSILLCSPVWHGFIVGTGQSGGKCCNEHRASSASEHSRKRTAFLRTFSLIPNAVRIPVHDKERPVFPMNAGKTQKNPGSRRHPDLISWGWIVDHIIQCIRLAVWRRKPTCEPFFCSKFPLADLITNETY